MLEGPHWSNMSVPMDQLTLPDGQRVSCPRNPILACADVTDVNASFVADPFLFFPNGTQGDWYAFFEVKNMNYQKKLNGKRGQIGTAVSRDEVMGIGLDVSYLVLMCVVMHCIHKG
jgi:hypothetical protein